MFTPDGLLLNPGAQLDGGLPLSLQALTSGVLEVATEGPCLWVENVIPEGWRLVTEEGFRDLGRGWRHLSRGPPFNLLVSSQDMDPI